MKNTTLTIEIVMGAVAIIALIWMVTWSAQQAEQVECYQLQTQSKAYPGFYLTEWQQQQCDRWGVEIDAPVK